MYMCMSNDVPIIKFWFSCRFYDIHVYLVSDCMCLIVELQHPVLVDPVTGIVQMITVLKNFPHMTKDYVRVVYMCF